ncbi:MAG: SDR family oxidoreductase [Proteobacteria bacterium]|nr:SDR family oxidoreductase [Pseudomonadota bacterium]
MQALVTGGAGFIGSHLVERLLAEGHAVRVLDNLSTGRRSNLDALLGRVSLTVGDIRDAALVNALSTGCDWVFHQAAIVSVPRSVEDPLETHAVNLAGTLNVLQAARDQGVGRVVFACSAAVYGDDADGDDADGDAAPPPQHENLLPAPASPYGLEKLTGEHYCRLFHRLYGLETVALRYFNVFGPRQDPRSAYSGVISIFVAHALGGTAPTIYGDGEQTRDFVYVEDVVRANLLAATAPAAVGRSYNIGRGEATTLKQLVAVLGHLAASGLAPRHAAARSGDVRHSRADLARARSELGYQPTVEVREGLRRLLAYERALR